MFKTPTFEEIRDAVLRDTLSLWPDADVSPDSDHYVHASRLAACASGQYAHQNWIVRQIFPDTADSAYLERHAALRGIRRRNPTAASGEARLSGLPGSKAAEGLQIVAAGRFYRTVSAAQIGKNGQAEIKIAAVEAGAAGNLANTAAELAAAPAGIASECTVSAAGGTDAESDASLLERLLERLRRPPAGGNRYDYKNWALNVDGVTAAYVYPLRRGLGTVDVAVTSAGGVPGDDIVRRVQAYIDDMRPVTAKNFAVVKPSVTAVDVSVQVKTDGITAAEAQTRIRGALAEYFDSLIPGDTVIVSRLEAAVSNIEGIVDRRLLSPQGNRAADTANKIEWFKLGRVTVGTMV